ncbi:MAG: type II secretion system F family protein [Solirubrobacterales bacterium]|nr:type II secretion system F family protein [Solirubrobacterales bacterium]
MTAAAPVILAAIGGGLVAIAIREVSALLPALAGQLGGVVAVLALAGRENRAPSERERRRLGLVAGAMLGGLSVLLTGSVPLAGLAAAGPAAAGWTVARRRRDYRRAVERDIPAIAGAVADAVAVGGSLRLALPAAAVGLRGASAVELARVCSDLGIGLAPHRALGGLSDRLESPRVDALVAAILSQQRAGGDLAMLLRRHGRAAAERERAEREARSATAQARMTGGLVVAMPLILALLVELIAPGFVAGLAREPAALALLGAAGLLQVAGFALIHRLGEVRG